MRVIICGDALTELRKLPDESVNMCVTSPPYWGLRDYGVPGQLGLEKTPEEYVAKMVEIFREVKRVLRKDGTLWLNLGDSYWGGKGQSGHANPEYQAARVEAGESFSRVAAHVGGQGKTRPSDGTHPIIKPKDLVGIPWRVAFALQADGWWLRQDIIWAKPNPMPESVRDRCTKAHEYIFMLSKSARYWYDAEAVKESGTDSSVERSRYGWHGKMQFINGKEMRSQPDPIDKMGDRWCPPKRNLRSVWTITTKPYKEAHFATFPPEIPERCIKAGCPAKICAKCGEPLVRVIERPEMPTVEMSQLDRYGTGNAGVHRKVGQKYQDWRSTNPDKTVGFRPTCTCDAGTVGGTVLDPFFGAGTTGLVALRLGREFIGIDLSPDYCEMAKKRIYGELQITPLAPPLSQF